MFIELMLFILAGSMCGILLGLIPGMHPNMIVLLSPLLLGFTALGMEWVYYITVFIVALGISNTFSSFIPSTYLGASDDAEMLATHPSHKMLVEGKGHEAVVLSVTGALFAILLCLILIPLIYFTVPPAYAFLKGYIWMLLAAMSFFMILSEPKWIKRGLAVVCFGLSGIFGLILLNSSFNAATVLFPILTGFFGIPILLSQIKLDVRIPKQTTETNEKTSLSESLFGTIGGVASGFLPGVGSSVMASLASKAEGKKFLSAVGAITGANMLISFLSLWLIGNPRSGTAVAISQIAETSFPLFLGMIFAALLATAIAAPVSIGISKMLATRIHKVNYRKLSVAVILFLGVMSFAFLGIMGIAILATSTCMGVFAIKAGVHRSVLMGVLIVPAIIFLF